MLARSEAAGGVSRHRLTVAASCLAASAAVACLEWRFLPDLSHFRYDFSGMPVYTRPSLVFAAFGVFVALCHPRARTNAVVGYLASVSLALYCLHPFFIPVADRFARRFFPDSLVPFGAFAFVLGFSYAGSHVLSRFLKPGLLR